MLRVSRRNFLRSGAALLAGGLMLPGRGIQKLLQNTRKRIYIAADDHTDYFWSADEATYQQSFLRMLDYYLDLADQTADEPPEHQSRWNCDGSFWLWTYEKNRPADQFERLINRLRDGHISAPLNALVVCLGGAPAEAVLRGMYYAGKLERRHNLRFTMAVAMENQTLPLGLIALWAGAGAKYSWKGVCGCDSRMADFGAREHEIYWAVGPDGSRILMKWNSLFTGDNRRVGGYAEARFPGESVEYVDTDAEFMARYPYRVIGVFGKGWDDLETLTDEFVTTAKAKTNASRQVIVSNEEDFFQDFETTYGGALPSVACSFGNEWDTYCAALAEVSASVKRSVEKLRSAEAMAALVALHDPALMSGREAARDQAWMSLGLFWEHNFGVVGRWQEFGQARVSWQRRLEAEIRGYVDALHADALNALAGLIQNDTTATRFFVFNALSWARTAVADLPYAGGAPVHVIDISTDAEVPSQLVSAAGQRYLRILAPDLPAVGYKVFEIRPGAGRGFSDAAAVDGGVIENARYRVTVAPRGAITSLIDKARGGREWVRMIDGRALNDLGPGAGALSVENVGPVSVTLVARSSAPLSHTTRLTLIRDSDMIEISNEITQNFEATHTWAFGFDLAAPEVEHEEVGAVVRARLLGDGGSYAARNARYDWLTLNHFADIHCCAGPEAAGVTLSNADAYFFRLGSSTVTSLDVNTPQISVLAGGRVGGDGRYGILNQGGDTRFLQRFALRTHGGYDPAQAMRFALEHQNPPVAALVAGGSAYPGTAYGLVTLSNPDVLLWALKPADDDAAALVARLWNLSGGSADCTLTLTPGAVAQAQQVTHLETPIGAASVIDGALNASFFPQQFKTFLLRR